ncbi:MAG: hypothetical protein ACKO2Z_02770, partial [Sphaerospermopsis kisseleviana]
LTENQKSNSKLDEVTTITQGLAVGYIVDQPGEWEFSSYLEYAGLRLGKIPKIDYIKMHIEEESAYQQFLLDYNLPNGIGFKRLLLDD